MNMNLEFKVIKYKHLGDKWFALYEMTKEMWAVVVYDNSEEDILFSCVEFDYATALKRYNLIRHNPQEYL